MQDFLRMILKVNNPSTLFVLSLKVYMIFRIRLGIYFHKDVLRGICEPGIMQSR